MNFQQLIRQTTCAEYEAAVRAMFPLSEAQFEAMKKMFVLMTSLTPKPTTYRARYSYSPNAKDEYFKYDISLVNGDTYGDDPDYADQPDEVKRQEVRYGLMGTSWAEFLSLEVPEESFNTATAGQLLANAFWDLSFFGFTPEQSEANLAATFETFDEAGDGAWEPLVLDNPEDVGPTKHASAS